ncbi:MAG: TerC family protein [Chloroflexi bacterium]|nr:TerC family protein [Chloroflexota bacterium]
MENFWNVAVALLTLTALEVVLGIDNIVFITILTEKLPKTQQPLARRVGLGLALGTRILLLLSLAWIIGLTEPWLNILGFALSGRDTILIIGGLFLLAKSTYEIHTRLEGDEGHSSPRVRPTFRGIVFQIMLLDIVFSLDSVITAVGMVDRVSVMVAAVVIAIIIMLISVDRISAFVSGHPTIKMLALSFLLLIGFSLVTEGLHQHIEKGYIYFAMGFSLFVEFLNLRLRQRTKEPVVLRSPYTES